MDDIRGAERGCHFTYRCDGPGSPYNRANGYSYNAEKIFCDKNGKVTRVMTRRLPSLTECDVRMSEVDLMARKLRPVGRTARKARIRKS